MKKTLEKVSEGKTITAYVSAEKYFSVTGDVHWGRTIKNDRTFECGGCIHDILEKHFPQVRSLIPIHLSDLDGVPMHALANGFWWVSGCVEGHFGEKFFPEQSQEKCFEILKRHFRINEKEAREVIELTTQGGIEALTAWVEERKKVWKLEAVSALALIQAL